VTLLGEDEALAPVLSDDELLPLPADEALAPVLSDAELLPLPADEEPAGWLETVLCDDVDRVAVDT
jgi:hypothetical protein